MATCNWEYVEPSELKIGVIHEDSAYGTSVAGHQEEYGAEKGLNIVTVQGYPSSTVDMSSLVLDLKDRDVDVVLQTSYQNDSVLFLNQSAEAGFEPDAIIGGGGGYSLTATAEAVGDKMEGVLDVDFTQYAVNTEFTPGLEDFLSAYQDKYGEDPRELYAATLRPTVETVTPVALTPKRRGLLHALGLARHGKPGTCASACLPIGCDRLPVGGS